ncbi:patatin-like phospholipase family protein [Psychrobacter sp. T6-1]|uniref:patatin-like phospholipase family protein n=1 Tax=Psychrobacter sp. T6-1 TaxID=3457447 RepID=UPI003FD0F707
MSNTTAPPYERVQLFSGGGSRFGYYLGSYAALVAHDLRPDLIIGTCGGSLSAYLVQLAPDPSDLQQLMRSRELYKSICAIRHVAPDEASTRQKLRYISNALKRWYSSRYTSQQPFKRQKQHQRDNYQRLLDELQQLAMFRIDSEGQWLDELSAFGSNPECNTSSINKSPEIAIIASRLRQRSIADFSVNADSLLAADFQLQELLFAPKRLDHSSFNSHLLHQEDLVRHNFNAPTHSFANGRIQQSVQMLTEWDMTSAVRASLADMYYLPPTHIDDLGWCLGGVINLTPIELACQLGSTVFAETKAGYDPYLAAPAIKRVFGFDPNQRLAQVHNYKTSSMPKPHHQAQIHWLPFADNDQQLAGQNVQKRFSLRQMTVELIHSDYDVFIQQMDAQWQYGYQRTMDYIRQQGL